MDEIKKTYRQVGRCLHEVKREDFAEVARKQQFFVVQHQNSLAPRGGYEAAILCSTRPTHYRMVPVPVLQPGEILWGVYRDELTWMGCIEDSSD